MQFRRPITTPGGPERHGRTPIIRRLLNSASDDTKEPHATPSEEPDLSLIGSVLVLAGFNLLNGMCCLITRAPVFYIFLAANVSLSALRLAAMVLCKRADENKQRWRKDSYVIITIIWCALESTMIEWTIQFGLDARAMIGLILVTVPQGAMATRSLPVPQFSAAIFLRLSVPFAMWILFCPIPWLHALAVLSPGYLFTTIMTIERLGNLIMGGYVTHFENWRRAKHDVPAGSLERRGTNIALEAQGRDSVCFALFAMECDGYKQVNHKHGHVVGDALLKMVMARLHRATRKEDLLAWVGSDQFELIAPGMPAAASEAVASRLATVVSEYPYDLGDGVVVRVTMSVGYACAPNDGVSLQVLNERAGATLCAMKRRCKWSGQRPAS